MTRERWCKTLWVRRHILDGSLVSSCRAGILTVFTFSEGNALACSCAPNKQSCIYHWQDNTHLIWTCSSFSRSPTSRVLLVHPWKTVVQCREHFVRLSNKNLHILNTDTLPHTHTPMTALPLPWCHRLGPIFADVGANPINFLGSNQH